MEAALLERLMGPSADLSPLLVVLLAHAEGTLLGIRSQSPTLAARGERRTTKKSDGVSCSEFKAWPLEVWAIGTQSSRTAKFGQT